MRRTILNEGNKKIVYEHADADAAILYFKDTVNPEYDDHPALHGKGMVNNRISELLFTRLHALGVANHFVKRLDLREQVVHAADILPFGVLVRNEVTPEMAATFDLEIGRPLARPVIEYYYRDKAKLYPMVGGDHLLSFNWCHLHEVDEIVALAMRTNDFLYGLFSGLDLRLTDLRLTFGAVYREEVEQFHIIVCGEISPDTCGLIDTHTGVRYGRAGIVADKEHKLVNAYHEVAHRLGLITDLAAVQEA